MSKKLEELRSKVASLKGSGTILKVADLESKVFVLDVEVTKMVEGQYGEQLLIVATYLEGELNHKKGDNVCLYLNNRRQEVFDTAYIGEGKYAFVFGDKTKMKNGFDYIPLELVEQV